MATRTRKELVRTMREWTGTEPVHCLDDIIWALAQSPDLRKAFNHEVEKSRKAFEQEMRETHPV